MRVADGCFFEPAEDDVIDPVVGRKKGSVGFSDSYYRRRSVLDSIPDNLSSEIPENFSNRYISDNNLYRVEIFPSKDLSKPEDLREFVSTIETFFPSATVMPIVQFNAGEIVIDSFKKSLII